MKWSYLKHLEKLCQVFLWTVIMISFVSFSLEWGYQCFKRAWLIPVGTTLTIYFSDI